MRKAQVVRPVAGLRSTYTVLLRFDSRSNLARWMESPERAELIAKAEPLLATGSEFFIIKSGLDFWFTPELAEAKLPKRWKQFLITWSALFPLAAGRWFLCSAGRRSPRRPNWTPSSSLVSSSPPWSTW